MNYKSIGRYMVEGCNIPIIILRLIDYKGGDAVLNTIYMNKRNAQTYNLKVFFTIYLSNIK